MTLSRVTAPMRTGPPRALETSEERRQGQSQGGWCHPQRETVNGRNAPSDSRSTGAGLTAKRIGLKGSMIREER